MKEIKIELTDTPYYEIGSACRVLQEIAETMESESVVMGKDLQPDHIETFFRKGKLYFTKETINDLRDKLLALIDEYDEEEEAIL